jgi:hypothetical protein
MLEQIKNKISENSGLVNMAINLAILFFLFSVASGVSDIKREIQSMKSSHHSVSNSEDRLKEMVITNLIQVLEAEQNKNKAK